MNFFQDYALLIAVAVPFAAIAGLNAFLWFGGERGTLVMPSARPYPVIPEAAPGSPAVIDVRQARESVAVAPAPANDECAREAA